MLSEARRYFHAREVLEVDVPFLSPTAVSDPAIESVSAQLSVDGGDVRYLHTSPEYALKKLLAAGFPDLFFLGRVFRDGEAGHRHQPEFTMAEWYRLGFRLVDIMRDTEALLTQLLDARVAGQDPQRMTYTEAFEQHLNLDPGRASIEELATLADADQSLREALGDDHTAWLDLLMATRLAPRLPGDRLTTLYHYPASQAALARLADDDATVAERFEVYCGEVELANGYVELTDGGELRRRFAADQAQRERQGLRQRPLDEAFIHCHEAGLPACAGVAVGFDRLIMLRAGKSDIRDVYHFPIDAPRGDHDGG